MAEPDTTQYENEIWFQDRVNDPERHEFSSKVCGVVFCWIINNLNLIIAFKSVCRCETQQRDGHDVMSANWVPTKKKCLNISQNNFCRPNATSKD